MHSHVKVRAFPCEAGADSGGSARPVPQVSLYYHSRSIKGISYSGTWDEWFEEFVGGTAPLPMAAGGSADAISADASDWFAHTLGWWRVHRACPQRVLWVRYEEMLASPLAEVRRVARVVAPAALDDDARLAHIVHASSFGEMKQRHEADPANESMRNDGEHGHFRQGRAGDWKRHLTCAQRRRFAAEMARRVAGTGLERAFEDDDGDLSE